MSRARMSSWGGFLRAGARMARHWASALRRQSLFKQCVVGGFAALFLFGLWTLFRVGFEFLENLGGVGVLVIHRLFALFFLGLGILLVLSTAISAFTTVVRSREVDFLWRLPVGRRDIVLYKSLQAGLLSSWAFLFIIVPFIGAYVQTEGLSPFFTLWTFVFALPFLALCSTLGVLGCLLVVRLWPRGWMGRALVWAGAALLLAGVVALVFEQRRVVDTTETDLSRLIPGIQLASGAMWPSWWLSEGIAAMSHGQAGRGFAFFGLLLSSAGVGVLLLEALGPALVTGIRDRRETTARPHRLFRRRRRRPSIQVLPADVRAVFIKDARLFIRDPAQWSQGAIFFGLLGLYFANLRTLDYHLLPLVWRNLIAFLNIFGLSAVMCSFGTRFLYPQLSLEGQAFWVLGRSPSPMGRILGIKFAGAFLTFGLVSLGLMALSALMLDLDRTLTLVALCLAGAMAAVISGLSIGLGAAFLNLRQRNPAVIISGFGGTLNLVLSLLFMLASILPFGILFHLNIVGMIPARLFARWMGWGVAGLGVITVLAAGLPLLAGYRSLQRREF